MEKASKPITAVPTRIALAGVCGAALASLLIWVFEPPALLNAVLFLCACALPMWVLELRRFPSRALRYSKQRIPSWRRKLRLMGLAFLIAMFCVTASMFRMLSPEAFAGFESMSLLVPFVAAGWMGWIALRIPVGRALDSVESLGKAIVRFFKPKRKKSHADLQALLGWLVKAFYLPLMLSSTYLFLTNAHTFFEQKNGWMSIFGIIYMLMFAVDTAFATVGYCSTSRRIDAHIRSTETTLLGWASALVCYPPLNLLVLHQWLSYRDGLEWDAWLKNWPVISFVWGTAILLSVGLYVSATVAFGPRFSNLTNRGIITSGPYQFFKHPSYIGKNIAWWLISVPFVSNMGALAAIGNCAALLVINGIYVVRAVTEERHLMSDPAYQAYSKWIAEHGLLERLAHWIVRKKKLATG
ncbi:protein-S-isoprenylcysteine O-methyltransferase Ste14 [Variovorax boronicumulans]|uniref:isoprenylcysteine carboxylmethyltransferase family protein n=1 Tax=Variovorax boronicumulans TaxID=436515 RepID=UPI0027880CFD|nr:isoprenylcysteine carboxylmethyltransferase family protein [Variovorax boronicumulans]MDQ0015065.1 protein-S-isoprenylcysteine O-methyltransferase Ste14 [Variovorax boronicumulans]